MAFGAQEHPSHQLKYSSNRNSLRHRLNPRTAPHWSPMNGEATGTCRGTGDLTPPPRLPPLPSSSQQPGEPRLGHTGRRKTTRTPAKIQTGKKIIDENIRSRLSWIPPKFPTQPTRIAYQVQRGHLRRLTCSHLFARNFRRPREQY